MSFWFGFTTGVFVGAITTCIFAIPYLKTKFNVAFKAYTNELAKQYKAALKKMGKKVEEEDLPRSETRH